MRTVGLLRPFSTNLIVASLSLRQSGQRLTGQTASKSPRYQSPRKLAILVG